MANAAADIFRQAAQLNRDDPCRRGNVVYVEPGCEMLVSGDLHGFRTGMTKVIAAAKLDANPQRRLIFQEIIHGPPEGAGGHDRSIDLLLRAARLKISHAGQVVFLLGNHDVAQVTGNEITKQGRGVCKGFVAGVEFAYADAAGEVLDAVKAFLVSMPIAARCPGRTFVAHSLPSPARMAVAGMGILEHPYADADLRRGGGAYEWTWGRDHTAEQLDALSQALDVDYFILGHRHSKQGYEVISGRGLTVNSDHEHGFVMRFAGDEPIAAEKLDQYLKPIMTLA